MDELNKKRIYEFDFLRILAALGVFINHIWAFLPFKMPDFGRRGVEIFFILSGFLMFYNYFNQNLSISFFDSIRFGIKKILPYWFLHIITMLLMLSLHVQNEGIIWLKDNIFSLVCNIFLIQTFVPVYEVYFGFNGVSWFLSSILFSYILFPFLLKLVKKIGSNEKKLMVMVLTYFGLMLLQSAYKGYGLYSHRYVFYEFPFYGLTLFFIGILLSSLFVERNAYTTKPKLLYLIFITLYGLGYFISIIFFRTWNNLNFIPIEILLIYFLGRLSGMIPIFSKLCSKKLISIFSALSFDFYLIHHVVILYYWKLHPIYISIMGREIGWKGKIFFIFITSLILSLFSLYMTKIIKKIIRKRREVVYES